MAVARGDVGIAFLLTTLAGLATMLGACAVFFASMVNRVVLAVSLGLAAGVMLFISFYDLLALTAVESFVDAGLEDKYAQLYAMLSFFGGVVLLRIIDEGLHGIARCIMRGEKRPGAVPPLSAAHGHGGSLPTWMLADDTKTAGVHDVSHEKPAQQSTQSSSPPGTYLSSPQSTRSSTQRAPDSKTPSSVLDDEAGTRAAASSMATPARAAFPSAGNDAVPPAASAFVVSKQETARLLRTGLLTAVVLGVHNFPEGIATFVSSLKDASLGASMCLAIALHNIPEGICVSMPVFYATGSKTKAFFWTFLSAMAEPFGALISYIALANVMSNLAFGILFGGVAGMMVAIVLVELLPAARKYDPEDKYVSPCMFLGMAVMSASLVLFDFSE